MGYLPQDVQLFPASIKANIARMQDDVDDAAVFEAAEIADVHEMISNFAMATRRRSRWTGAPVGRTEAEDRLARAFYGDPRLVVLDEPNSNLDTAGEAALARSLLRAKTKGITVVAITQRPALLKHVDKIMLLKDGAVQAFGTREKMLPLLGGATQRRRSSTSDGGATHHHFR